MSSATERPDALGQYQLLKKLGAGAAGEVYLAEHAILEQRYAVKVLHRQFADQPAFTTRFFREARLASRLVHPNIGRVITADHSDGHYYMVMEFIDGPSLESLVRAQGPLDPRQAVRYVTKVLDALHYAHQQGMLHRDVKAANVLLDTGSDEPKLVDFGLVLDTHEGSQLTAHDAVVGTPYYMPPEQWRNADLDERADVFSAGVLLYHLMTGAFPFPGDSPIHVAHRIETGPHEPLDLPPLEGLEPSRAASLLRDLRAIVDQALAREQPQRFASARAMGQALNTWLDTIDQPVATQSLSPSTSSPTPSAKPMTSSAPSIDLRSQPVEIAENTYWVGKRPRDEIFYANPYLRHFPGQSADPPFNLIIDPGSSKDFSVVQSKVSQILGSIKQIDSIFINHQDPDVGSSVGLMLGRYTPEAHVLCTEDTWRLVHYYNIPRERFVPLEKYPRGIQLPSGQVIIPVPSPFCHFVGAMMLYDPDTRVLFSGDLFGGLTDRDARGIYADDSDWTGMRAFHQIYMPTQSALQNAIRNIRQLTPKVEIIAPQHGRVIRGDLVDEYMERLYHLPVGLDILDDRHASDEELQAWTTVLRRMVDVAKAHLGDDVIDILDQDPNLSGHITIGAGQQTSIQALGKTSVEQAVRKLTQRVPHGVANAIKYEVVYAAEELGLPTPAVELDEDGTSGGSSSGPSASDAFGAAK